MDNSLTQRTKRLKKTFLAEIVDTSSTVLINIRVIDCSYKWACLASYMDIVSLTISTSSGVEVLSPSVIRESLVQFYTSALVRDIEGILLNTSMGNIEIEVSNPNG